MKKGYDSNSRGEFIEQIEAGEKRVSELARELGITENTFYNWRKQLEDDTEHGFMRRSEKAPRHSKNEWY